VIIDIFRDEGGGKYTHLERVTGTPKSLQRYVQTLAVAHGQRIVVFSGNPRRVIGRYLYSVSPSGQIYQD